MNIQWYPGHMTKTRRQIEADLKHVDIVVELADARIPISSRNPDINAICGEKPRVLLLNRADQADPQMNRVWVEQLQQTQKLSAAAVDSRGGGNVGQLTVSLVRRALADQIAKWRERGQVGRPIRAMVVGVPNVGKSTFINKVAGRKSAKAGDRPGVTRGKQWVSVDAGLELLDTPGILWPKFEDETTGLHLAFTGAVKDEVTDLDRYPGALEERYKLTAPAGQPGWELLERCARQRGMLISGGEVDTERMAGVLLDEFRGGKLGRFTLESPEG